MFINHNALKAFISVHHQQSKSDILKKGIVKYEDLKIIYEYMQISSNHRATIDSDECWNFIVDLGLAALLDPNEKMILCQQ